MKTMNEVKLISYCGLYCGACKKYIHSKCSGCRNNQQATWCNIRKCCIQNGFKSCADCTYFEDVMLCNKFNNLISRAFSIVFRTQKSCIERIKLTGYPDYADFMSRNNWQVIRKK